MKHSVIISLCAGICVFVCNGTRDIDDYIADKQLTENLFKYFLIGQIFEKYNCKGLAAEHNIRMFTALLHEKEVADDLAAEEELRKNFAGYISGYNQSPRMSPMFSTTSEILYTAEGESLTYQITRKICFNGR